MPFDARRLVWDGLKVFSTSSLASTCGTWHWVQNRARDRVGLMSVAVEILVRPAPVLGGDRPVDKSRH